MRLSKSLSKSQGSPALWPKLTVILIAVVVAVGFLVRVTPVFHDQIYFWFDQGLDIILTKVLVVDHRLNLVSRYSGLAGVLMGPLWTWLLAIPFSISSGNPAANTVFFSLFATVSSLMVYKFILPLGRSAAVFSLIVFLFAPILITYSQLVASPHPLSFLFIFYVWFLFRLVIEKKVKYWVPLFLLVGIFFQLEIGFALFTLPVILMAIIVFQSGHVFKSRYFPIGFFVFCLTFLPQVLFDLRHQFLISRGILTIFQGKSSLYGAHDSLSVRFFERAKSFRDDFILMALYIQPTALAVFALLVSVTGWAWAFKNRLSKYTNTFKLLSVIIATFYVGFSFYPGPLWTWYRAGLPIVYILLVTIGWGAAWDQSKVLRPAVIGLLLVFVYQGINPTQLVKTLRGDPVADNAIWENQEMAIDYVYKNASGRPFSYFAYTPPVYDYIWQYGFWWYGQRKYGYLPNNWQMGVPLLGIGQQATPPVSNQGLFFLVLEPNDQRPWEPDGWRKSYIKVGAVLAQKEFPGRIVVEMRTTN